MTTAPACPQCGDRLAVITDGLVGEVYHPGFIQRGAELPTRMVRRPFYACSGCEFCVETRDLVVRK